MHAHACIAFRCAIIYLVLDRRRHRIAHLCADKGPELGILLRGRGQERDKAIERREGGSRKAADQDEVTGEGDGATAALLKGSDKV